MNELKIFDIVPEGFFTPLSSGNKKIYLSIISLIYKLVQNGLSYGIDREVLVEEVEDYLNGANEEFDNEEIGIVDDEIVTNNRDRANIFIRKLTNYGWIYPETTSDYRQIINFHDYSIVIIEALVKIVNNESTEYQGNIIGIYNILYSKEKINSGLVVKQIFNITKEIMSGLKKLNANIKKYIDRLTKQKTPQEILEELFGSYAKDIIDKSYHRLKTSENISRYRPLIIERLNEMVIDDNVINEASEFFVKELELNSLEQGKELVKDKIYSVINSFEDVDDIIKEIDIKHAKYIKAAVTRAKFLLNNSRDITGTIKSILEYTCDQYKDLELNLSVDYLEELSDLFVLYSYDFIDETSLYIANEGSKSFKPEKVNKTSISKEERERKLKEFKTNQEKRYSHKKVNEIVDELLGDKKMISASEIEVKTIDDYIKIIYIRLFGSNSISTFKVKGKKSYINKNGFKFKDFEIWRSE